MVIPTFLIAININRKDLVKSTLKEFSNKSIIELRQQCKVEFIDEKGYDAGGLTREWMTIINAELFDPERGLFKLSPNTITLQPNLISQILPSHLVYLELAGIMLAKVENYIHLVYSISIQAIQMNCPVDVNLTKPFLKHILSNI